MVEFKFKLFTTISVAIFVFGSIGECATSAQNKQNNLFLFNDFLQMKMPAALDFLLHDQEQLVKSDNFTSNLMKLSGRSLGYEFQNEWQNIVAKSSPTDKDASCFQQIGALVSGLATGDLKSLQYFDSWGKIPAGLLKGSVAELGNFDECVDLTKTLADQSELVGKYCLASIPFAPAGGLLDINIGVCMPATCSATEFDIFFKSLLKSLLNLNFSAERNLVNEASCLTRKKDPFTGWDWFAVSVLSILGGALLFSTVYEYVMKLKGEQPNLLLSSFSIPSNLSQLLRVQPNTKNPNIIPCLNGIRCLSIIWIVLGHSYSMFIFIPNINVVDVIPWTKSAYSMLIQYAIFSVDTFFFLSGLLVAFLALREMDRQQGKLNVPMMYVHRILRLTPMLAMAVLIYGSLYRHMANGPIWPVGREWNHFCDTNWWSTLLYVQNYVNPQEMCVAHTWYLSVDMQLYLFSPIFLIAMWRYKEKGVAFVGLIALLFVACLFTNIMVNDFVFHMKGVYAIAANAMVKTYYATHSRTSPWFLGLILGYFLNKTKNSRVKLNKLLVVVAWLISFALISTVLFSWYAKANARADATTVEEAFYWTLARVAWPLALSWLVFACVHGYGGPINAFLSCPLWQPLARLSYCVYIWHIFFVEFHVGRIKTNHYFSDYDITLQFWGDFGWTLLLSTVMYLAFEAPLLNLEKILLPKGNKAKTAETTSRTNLV